MQAEFIGFKQQTQQEMPCTYLDSRWCFYTCGIEWTCRAWKKTCVHTPWYTMCSTLRTLDNILSFVSMPYMQSTSSFHVFLNFTNFLLKKKQFAPPISAFSPTIPIEEFPRVPRFPQLPRFFHQRQGFYRHYSFLLRPSEVPRDHNVRPLYGNKGLARVGLATGLEHHQRWKERRVFFFFPVEQKNRYRVFETLRLLQWGQHTMFEVSIVANGIVSCVQFSTADTELTGHHR